MNQKAFHESSKHFTTSLQNLNFHKKKNFALSSSVFQYIFTILQVYLSKRKFHNHRVYIEKVKCLFYMPTAVYIVLLQYVDVWRHWEGKWKRKRKNLTQLKLLVSNGLEGSFTMSLDEGHFFVSKLRDPMTCKKKNQTMYRFVSIDSRVQKTLNCSKTFSVMY